MQPARGRIVLLELAQAAFVLLAFGVLLVEGRRSRLNEGRTRNNDVSIEKFHTYRLDDLESTTTVVPSGGEAVPDDSTAFDRRSLDIATFGVVLDFEGVERNQSIGNFYAQGGGGPNYGITFGTVAVANTVGSGTNRNNTALRVPGGSLALMTVEAGFTSLSFQAAISQSGSVSVYLYASDFLPLLRTGISFGCDPPGAPACGGPNGTFGTSWFPVDAPFNGVATYAEFDVTGALVIDNMTLNLVIPTPSPTSAPTQPPCNGATYWVYDLATNATRRLVNNTATCLVHPYSIEVRPCDDSSTPPVSLRLVRAKDGRLVHRQRHVTTPYYLFGDVNGSSARPSPAQLPNGKYYLSSSLGKGRLTFKQSCPCPKSKKRCRKK